MNRKQTIEIKCAWCGKVFETERKRKYCSSRCRELYGRRPKYKSTCIICGKDFLAKKSSVKTCSKACMIKSRGIGLIEKNCKYCNTRFKPKESRQKFCTEQCQKKNQRKNDRQKRSQIEMIRRKTDIPFVLSNRMRVLMYHTIRKTKNGRRWQDLVGYSIEELRQHIEKQFKNGMTWEKFFKGEIHIDHKIPVSVFNITSPEDIDFKKCWDLSNLRPMWASQNISKGNKLQKSFQPSLNLRIN